MQSYLRNIENKMRNHLQYIPIFCLLLLNVKASEVNQKPYIIGNLLGQAGNNFFQIATTCAVAWDHDADPYFPQLGSLPTLYHHYFSRCKALPPSEEISFDFEEQNGQYTPIPYQPNMRISGYLQSWKYFDHYKDRLIALFSPIKKDKTYIEKKYDYLLNHPNTVGIQIRYYKEEAPSFIQLGRDYFKKAMELFPKSSLFVVSSNNIDFAKSQVPTEGLDVIFLEGEPSYIDFHLLTRLHHTIITNSTFGWWIAYLNQNPKKMIICPEKWVGGHYPDIYPDNWIQIEANRIN